MQYPSKISKIQFNLIKFQTYVCLHHRNSVLSHFRYKFSHVYYSLSLAHLKQGVQSNVGPRSSYTSAK